MSQGLRTEQPNLWNKVIALALSLVFIGIPFLLRDSVRRDGAYILTYIMPLDWLGGLFILLGLLLGLSTLSKSGNYRLTRLTLSIIIAYTIAWLLALIYASFIRIGNITVLSLFAYYVYTIVTLLKDPGFAVAPVIRKIRGKND